jgi:hypothetical protein
VKSASMLTIGEYTVDKFGLILGLISSLISTRAGQIYILDFAQNPNEHGLKIHSLSQSFALHSLVMLPLLYSKALVLWEVFALPHIFRTDSAQILRTP